MKASEFVEKLKDVAENYNTLYVMGCFGAPMTEANKKRYCNNHSYNRNAIRAKLIQSATEDTFGFDCVCLIKAILWGWNGNTKDVYGGAVYKSNNVPDIDANTMIRMCSAVTTDFNNIEVGEVVWTNGHIGVYIGNGLAVECTPAWENRVQITACNCTKAGYDTRTWKKHGRLPYIEYDVVTQKVVNSKDKISVKIEPAQSFNASLAGSYKVTALCGLHIRSGPGVNKSSLNVLPKGSIVKNFGYYTEKVDGTKWFYVKTSDNLVGFCSSRYLSKC